ncbi:hypothetical protein E2F50_08990 [Rhizobium deserti]|uniref:Uncharacterized protein n=1 Tax=Rhizobium deserti TaxID=2547961 RepID=A0A4R5UJU8_9HYPH|nr:hypothetical protein [Rhizobium deserti]TDK37029.1 hypothetical protein E2F50_08990 [Rhizobium deserti]
MTDPMGNNGYDGQLHELRVQRKATGGSTPSERATRPEGLPRKNSSRAGWIYVAVSLLVVVPVVTVAVVTVAWLNFRSGTTAPTYSASGGAWSELPTTATRYIEPALGGRDIKLREDFNERSGWPLEGAVLTSAGYPLIIARKEAPACANPYQVKEALDALRSADRRWLNAMPGCELIATGTVAEWITTPYKGLEIITMRLALPDGSRKTLYAPSNNPEVGIEAWFGHRYYQ